MPLFQDVDAKLTLTRVATAPVLVAEISKLTGRKLEVSPTLSTEVLMVSVEDAGTTEVLTKLAIAATAAWQPIEGGYRLVPDVAARLIEGSSERARRFQSITEGLRKKEAIRVKHAAAMKAAGTNAEPVEAPDFGAMFGGGDGTDAFLPMLDLNALANMEAGDRIVFATSPNSAQRPLRGNPNQIVGTWIARHNKSAKTMGKGMDEMPEEMAGFMSGPFGDRMKKMSRPVTAAPAKIVVVASRGANPLFGGMGLDVRLEVRAYGADGAILIEQTGSLDTDMMEMFAAMASGKKPAAITTKTTPIAYSDDAKAFLEAGGGGNSFMDGPFGKASKMPDTLRARLFAPDKFDPLALVPGEGLVALAKARRKPLVASVPDAAYPGLINDGPAKTVEDVEESLKTGTMRLVPDTTFLVVRAAEPETARRTRIDRIALASLMRAVADHETPNLDELAAFATKTPPPSRSDLSMSYLTKFVPTSMGSMSGLTSWDALRLYGALTPGQRTSLTEGGRVPFANLTPVAQGSLRSMLYGAEGNLSVERPGVSNESDIFSVSMKMMMGGGGTDVRDEPTEVAPRGLPMDGYLQAAVTADSVIRPISSDGPVYYALGTDELAMFKLMTSSGLPQSEQDGMKLPEMGRLGSRTTWNIRGYVAPGAYVESTLNDDRTPKSGATVRISNLPADLQAKIAQKTEKLKKSPLGAMMSMGAAFGGRQPQGQP